MNRNISEKIEQTNLTESSLRRAFVNESLQNIPLFFYEETDSTNTRAKIYAGSDTWRVKREDTVFISKSQTGGRGRLGRSFLSDGRGLYMSYLFCPKESLSSAIQYTARAAVIAAEAVEELSGTVVRLKWVNDLYAGGKKLAGILTEGRTDKDGRLEYMIIGIGVNVLASSFPEELSDTATDIETVSGNRISIPCLAAKIAAGFEKRLSDPSLISEYKARSFLIGEHVTVLNHGESYPATVLEIANDASLIVKTEGGSIERLSSAEISIRKRAKKN